MLEDLSDIRQAVIHYAKSFDASVLGGLDAERVVAEANRIESAIVAVKALAAARAAETTAWKHLGGRSPADALGQATGTTLGRAKELIDTGRRLAQAPDIADAALSGTLSPAKASLLAETAEVDPSKTNELLDQSGHASIGELKDELARTKAAHTDLETRKRAIHANRRYRSWTDRDGVWHVHAHGNPEDGVLIDAALSPYRQRAFARARQAGKHEHPDAYGFDGLLALALAHTTSHPDSGYGFDPATVPDADHQPNPDTQLAQALGIRSIPGSDSDPPPNEDQDGAAPRTKRPKKSQRQRQRRPQSRITSTILARVDMNALLRGVPLAGELCEINGVPVPVSSIEKLIETTSPVIKCVLTRGQQVVGIAHMRRSPNAAQRAALDFIYPTCAALGCNQRARLERDHRIDWAKTHYTLLDQLDLLCHHHHALKTRMNWALIAGEGKRLFLPPTDPRHPDHQHTSPTDPNHPDHQLALLEPSG